VAFCPLRSAVHVYLHAKRSWRPHHEAHFDYQPVRCTGPTAIICRTGVPDRAQAGTNGRCGGKLPGGKAASDLPSSACPRLLDRRPRTSRRRLGASSGIFRCRDVSGDLWRLSGSRAPPRDAERFSRSTALSGNLRRLLQIEGAARDAARRLRIYGSVWRSVAPSRDRKHRPGCGAISPDPRLCLAICDAFSRSEAPPRMRLAASRSSAPSGDLWRLLQIESAPLDAARFSRSTALSGHLRRLLQIEGDVWGRKATFADARRCLRIYGSVWRSAKPCTLLRGFSIGGHEPAVGVPELLADLSRRGVGERCRRAVQGLGSGFRILLQELLHAERLDAFFARSTAAASSIW
jgi:hypothetical protein